MSTQVFASGGIASLFSLTQVITNVTITREWLNNFTTSPVKQTAYKIALIWMKGCTTWAWLNTLAQCGVYFYSKATGNSLSNQSIFVETLETSQVVNIGTTLLTFISLSFAHSCDDIEVRSIPLKENNATLQRDLGRTASLL